MLLQNVNKTDLDTCIVVVLLGDVCGARYGSILQGKKKRGDLVDFPRAKPKQLEIEIYLLNRNIAVRPLENQVLVH